VMRLVHHTPHSLGQDHATEMYAAGPLTIIPRIMGSPLKIHRLRFTHAPRAPLETYERILGCIPKFEQEENVWSWHKSVFDTPMPNPDGALVAFYERYLANRFVGANSILEHQLRCAISQLL